MYQLYMQNGTVILNYKCTQNKQLKQILLKNERGDRPLIVRGGPLLIDDRQPPHQLGVAGHFSLLQN